MQENLIEKECYFNREEIYYSLFREPKNKDFSDFEFKYINIEPFEGYQYHIKKGSLFNKINDKFILIDEDIIFQTNIIHIFKKCK